MDTKDNGPMDLKLCGEQINLITRSRFADDVKKTQNKFRPRSALYTTNKITPEHTRRPFSAGTEPTTPKLHSFLRPNTEKPDLHYYRNSEFFKDALSIPGITESSLLCDKLINDPIDISRHIARKKYFFDQPTKHKFDDSVLENSSADICTSLGTKIKAKSKMADNYEIEGSSVRLKKIRPHITWSTENLYDNSDERKTTYMMPEKDDSNAKLSIHVPNAKEDNTSSGVSSSSDIQTGHQKTDNEETITSHRLSKSKKNSNLYGSWSSPWSNRDTESPSYNENKAKDENLVGRVSFGKPYGELHSQEQYEAYPLFDTQLSLVEEESSQDSDISTTLLSMPHKVLNNDDKLMKNMDKTIEKYIRPISYNEFSMQQKRDASNLNNNQDNSKYSRSYSASDDDENDLKFKALEEKYKIEKLKSNLTNSWTNLENVVTKDVDMKNEMKSKHSYNDTPYYSPMINDDLQSTRKDVSIFSNYNGLEKDLKQQPCHVPEEYQREYVINTYKSDYNDHSHLKSDKENVTKNKTHCIPEIQIEGMPLNDNKISIKDIPVVTIDKNLPQCESMNKDKHELRVNEADSKLNADYPLYLEGNESKMYTSKVIEEYKKEIASINNFHELTLKDLRRKCDDLKMHMIDDSTEEIKKKIMLSTSDEDDGDEDVEEIVPLNRERYNYDMIDHSEIQKKPQIKQAEKSKVRNDSKDQTTEIKTRVSRPKLRKKVKKRENNVKIDAKPKIENEQKKVLENTSALKKNNGIMKFKAQKITMSRSTTHINHTVYIDNDKDVRSWMETRANTPFQDNSSYENIDFDKATNGRSIERPTNKNKQMVHFENDIVPIIKSSSVNSRNQRSHSADAFVGKHDKLWTPDEHYTIESGETFKSSDLENNFHNNDHNELSGLVDDDAMVADIYSTLQDININTHRSRDEKENNTLDKIKADNDENMTAEYKDIIVFLERVEKTASEDMSSLSHNQPPFALKVEELMDLSKAELAHRAVVGALAAGRAASAAAGLREALNKAAKASAARLKVAQATAKHHAATAAAQAAQTMAKHQKFIEQLVNEKKGLTERIEQLAGAAAGAEARRGRAARTAAERLQLELRNQRQRLAAVHQRDKQAWLKHHTQKIKEMTVKGLESELQEIERNHTAAIAKIQQSGEGAIMDLKEQHVKELRKLKDAMTKQLEDEIDKERLLAAERLEQKRVEWEAALLKAAERAGQEAREAAHRAEESAKNARVQAELWKKEQEQALEHQKNQIDKQAEEKKNLMMMEISQMKEKLNEEFKVFTEEHCKKQAMILKEREMEIRVIMRRERDREIEKAIDCMEIEAEEGRKEMHEAVRRIKDKYENDIQALEESEKVASQRCKEARNQLREMQEMYATSQITITQLEGKLKQAEELRNQNESKTEMLVRGAEMRGHENIEQLRAQMQNLEQQHKDEMHQLFAKVKVVVARKDDAVTLARREASNLRERCIRLESRLTPS